MTRQAGTATTSEANPFRSGTVPATNQTARNAAAAAMTWITMKRLACISTPARIRSACSLLA